MLDWLKNVEVEVEVAECGRKARSAGAASPTV